MDIDEREAFFLEQEEKLLIGGASFSEWCTFISKDVYSAFINGADIATILTAMACIETYLKSENAECRDMSLIDLIDRDGMLTDKEKQELHILRKYRNGWVHADRIDDTELLVSEVKYKKELKEMSFLSVQLLLKVLFSNQFV